jgi:predicted nucleic acid-binding protein
MADHHQVTFLVDTTVLILRERHDAVLSWFTSQLSVDNLAVCDVVVLEYLMGARSGRHYDELDQALGGLHQVSIEPIDWERAREVHRDLAHQTGGGQRAVKIPDLIVAAAAERADLPIAHYDEDYDRISAITGQASVWVAPRGSL